MFSKNKFLTLSLLLLVIISSILLNVKRVDGHGKSVEKRKTSSTLKEKGFLHILLAILDDPEFLTLDYTEQHKILDDFYKHVKTYAEEEKVDEHEKELIRGNRIVFDKK